MASSPLLASRTPGWRSKFVVGVLALAFLVMVGMALTAEAFGQRRKMLRSSLKGLGGGALCEKAGISPDARAEVIDLAGFLALARASLGQASA